MKKKQKATSTRFELARAEPSRFLIYLLNHSDTTSFMSKQSHKVVVSFIDIIFILWEFIFILTWRGRGSCSPKRVINKARRLIEYTALHAAVCGRLWLQLRLYVRRRIFARVELCACRRLRTKKLIQHHWQRVRVVKEVDSKSTGLCPREFKSRRCRFFVDAKLTPKGPAQIFGSFAGGRLWGKKLQSVGIEPTLLRTCALTTRPRLLFIQFCKDQWLTRLGVPKSAKRP